MRFGYISIQNYRTRPRPKKTTTMNCFNTSKLFGCILRKTTMVSLYNVYMYVIFHRYKIYAEIMALDQPTVAEIKSYSKPPAVVHTVMTGVFIALGHKEKEMKVILWRWCIQSGIVDNKTYYIMYQASIFRYNDMHITRYFTGPSLRRDKTEMKLNIISGVRVFHTWESKYVQYFRRGLIKGWLTVFCWTILFEYYIKLNNK